MSRLRQVAVTSVAALAVVLLCSQAAQTAPAASPGVVQGSILNVDLANNRIHVIQPDGKIFVFVRVPDSIVTLNGKPYSFNLLLVGWKVTVHFNDSTRVALRIDAIDL